MTDPEDAVIYRYEPRFEGEFFRGVPARDLTQRDVDKIDALTWLNASAPHPLYGVPLYVAVGDDGKPPKWFQALQEKAPDGVVIAPMLPKETQAAYHERIAAMQNPPASGDGTSNDETPPDGDGTQEGSNEPSGDGEA